jgi:hypothetical protein
MWRLFERLPGTTTTALRLHLRRTTGKPEAARLRELLEQAEAAAEAKAKQELNSTNSSTIKWSWKARVHPSSQRLGRHSRRRVG